MRRVCTAGVDSRCQNGPQPQRKSDRPHNPGHLRALNARPAPSTPAEAPARRQRE